MTDKNLPEWQLAQWTLDVEGKKIGPFTPEQVEGFLEEGEILGHHKATSPGLEGEWISVEELITAFKSARKRETANTSPPEDTSGTGSGRLFTPPPRPTEPPVPELPAVGPGDPARDLFDVLQAARNKKAGAKFTPPLVESREPSSAVASAESILRKVPRQVWLIGAITLGLASLIWAISAMLGPDEPAQPVVERAATPNRRASPPKPAPKLAPKPTPKVTPRPRPTLARPPSRPRVTPRAAPPNLRPRQAAPPTQRQTQPDRRENDERQRGYEEPFFPNQDRLDDRDLPRDDLREREYPDREFPEEGDFPPDAEPRRDGSRFNDPNYDDPHQNGATGYDEPTQEGGYPGDPPQTLEFYESGP